MYAIDKRRCRLVKRQGITGRTEATDRHVLILHTRKDQYRSRKIRQIIDVPVTLSSDFGSAEYLDGYWHLLQRLFTALRCHNNLFEHERIAFLRQNNRWFQRYD